MEIEKVIIDNFKSIDHIELDFDKVGDSYTKIFVGINESGKSNILEALSYFKVPDKRVSYDSFCNQKKENGEDCKIRFWLKPEENSINLRNVDGSAFNLDTIWFMYIEKDVTLSQGSDKFVEEYNFSFLSILKDFYYIKKVKDPNSFSGTKNIIVTKEEKDEYSVPLTGKYLIQNFTDQLDNYVKENEPVVSFWQPTPKYLLSDVDLHAFSKKIDSNKPLRNIFYLSGYKKEQDIVKAINEVNNSKKRSVLSSKLNNAVNTYINRVWSNKISVVIEITETGKMSFLIKDQGAENEHNRFELTERSQGAQQFLSLILSLSLEAETHERKNELILIDEPETHLHPSGIRDLGKELLKVGEENYVFLATHSPFIIDKSHKERHYIVKKNSKAITEIVKIKDSDNIIDDEVLNMAFGINVFKDLMNPHRVLVEGASDKVILQKGFAMLGRKDIGITNGHGSNIDTLASKMNYDNISILIVVDDDDDGQKYKENILKIGGVFNDKNVFTIRDLEGGIVSKGTIEDILGIDYIKSQFIDFYKKLFSQDPKGFELIEGQPIIQQIIAYLKKNKQYSNWDMDAFKTQVAESFNPTKSAFENDYKQLKNIVEKIINILK